MAKSTAALLAELEERLEQSLEPGSPNAVARRDAKGLLSPRRRIELLLDPGTFMETGQLAKNPGSATNPYGDGVVTGHGLID
ncbi:MAG: methylmalonyl-CoA carboxyltransferase, partial [Rhodococcus sp.]|nr:methylmalonyl-CoA carboxyltransferase [Rhodococcus sp. (in: high G+C Gram-positive bacteria)]